MKEMPIQRTPKPPRLLEVFVQWCLPPKLKEPVVGDLSEEFLGRLTTNGRGQARIWYMRQAVRTGLQFIWQTQRGMLMFLIGIVLFLGFMLMGMSLGGGTSMYIDIPSLLMVVPPAIILGIGATSWNSFATGLALLTNDVDGIKDKDYVGAAKSFSVIGNTAIWVGLVATFIGWVAMGANIFAADFAKVFGPALAVSVLTVIYGMLIKVLCYVAEQRVLFKMNQAI